MTQSPLQQLIELDWQYSASPVPAPEKATTLAGASAVVFSSGDAYFLLPLTFPMKILPAQPLIPLPRLKPWVKGVFSYQEKAFPVLDWQYLLNQQSTSEETGNRLLMIETEGLQCALLVERVLGVRKDEQLAGDEMLKQSLQSEGSLRARCCFQYHWEENEAYVLSLTHFAALPEVRELSDKGRDSLL